jgi:hypothetical protein
MMTQLSVDLYGDKSESQCSTHPTRSADGGLGDYMAQEAINDDADLKVIDGFRGLVGYDLDNLDAVSGPISEKGYMKSYAQTWNLGAYCCNRYVRLMH